MVKAREAGVDITAETCPHYLVLEKSDYYKYGSLIKVNPPIRGGVHRETLLKATARGVVDAIGSDHAPSRTRGEAEKHLGCGCRNAGCSNAFPHYAGLSA
ncbi:MAG: hypothetical protein QXM43_02975 [Desulfurococcaceae archaeon]